MENRQLIKPWEINRYQSEQEHGFDAPAYCCEACLIARRHMPG